MAYTIRFAVEAIREDGERESWREYCVTREREEDAEAYVTSLASAYPSTDERMTTSYLRYAVVLLGDEVVMEV